MATDDGRRSTTALLSILGVAVLSLLALGGMIPVDRVAYFDWAIGCGAGMLALWWLRFAVPALMEWSEEKLRIPALEKRRANAVARARLSDGAERVRSVGVAVVLARYGAGDKWLDVTERLKSKAADGTLDMEVSNETMGHDPAEGVVKALELDWLDANGPHKDSFAESTRLTLP